MDDLVKKHPLYDQLARYDRSIEAFDLTATAPQVAAADPNLAARERDLQKELNDAADRTRKLVDQKQKQYQQQEAAAIAAALRGAGAGGPSAAQIAGTVNATARQQQSGVAVQAQRDLNAYRSTLQKQDAAQVAAASKALGDRADRTYRAKAEELQSKESALSLKMASEDAPQRLALRTKLTSLALDDAAREDAQKQLGAIDRKEADALASARNRDQQTLVALQAQLKDQVQGDLNAQVAAIRKRSLGSLAQRQQSLSRQVSNLGGPVVKTNVVNGQVQQRVNSNLPPALRARIEQLHNDYQKRFQADAKTTIADFNKTRADLGKRYAQLHGIDSASQQGAQAQIMSLRKKREDLYTQITEQIDREVRLIAQQRGISVVLTNIVAPAGGVDLTPDALKDIESLHE
ncbi:MAG TPA: OmpH family outer membrane protein [Candidatus Elarobacter sp.]|nr:OmpH family outer membrane protein [Candidatus Elarobacter sp.]